MTKDKDAVLDYGFDWRDWLDGDEIASSTWDVPTGLTAGVDSHEGGITKVWLSGGTVGTRYSVTNEITTTAGRTDQRTIKILVTER